METHERIARLRDSLGLTRERFEEITQISRNTIRAIETKGVTPRSDVLVKISQAWPCYALWLLTGEDAPLAGQFSPIKTSEDLDNESLAYQIIDVIDRNLDQSIVKPSTIEKVIFLQTADVPVSDKIKRLLNTTIYHRGKFAQPIVENANFGTAVLLVVSGTNPAGFKRAVLVKDGSFDLNEIEQKDGIFGLLGDIKRWFESNGIRRFEIAAVSHQTLAALERETEELKLADIYQAPASVNTSFKMWCEAFTVATKKE
jgi:transcriptional regulator with XRE-family HTH domain